MTLESLQQADPIVMIIVHSRNFPIAVEPRSVAHLSMFLCEKRCIAVTAGRSLLTLAALVISLGKLSDPRRACCLIVRVGEELKMQGVFSHEHWWLALYMHVRAGVLAIVASVLADDRGDEEVL